MADLPTVNAIEELKESNIEQRQKLQKSMREGMRLNRVELVNINQSIIKAFNLNEQMIALEKEKMRRAEEERRERERLAAQPETEKGKTPAESGGLGLLGIAGIVAGITSAITAFATALSAALLAEGIKYQKMFNKAFATAFRPFTRLFNFDFKKTGEGFGSKFRAFSNILTNNGKIFEDLGNAFRSTIQFFRDGGTKLRTAIVGFGAMLTTQGQLFDDIAKGIRAVVLPIINGVKFIIEPLRASLPVVTAAGETAKEGVGFFQKVKDSVTAFLTPFRAMGAVFEPIIKVVKGLATTIGRAFFPLQIIIGAFNVVTETIEGFQEGGLAEGLKRGFTALLDATIFLIPNLLKDAISFVADFFGFENVSKFLDQMSIGELVMEILSYPIKAIKGIGSTLGNLFGLGDDESDAMIEEEKKALSSRRQEAELRKQKLEEIKQQSLAEEQQALEESEKLKARLTAESADRSAQELSQEIDSIDRQLRENNRLRLEAQKFNASPEQMEALNAERDRLMASRRDLRGAEIDVRSREVAAQVAQPNVTVAAPQTSIQTDNSTRVNKTSVASASPRRDNKPWWAGRNYATN